MYTFTDITLTHKNLWHKTFVKINEIARVAGPLKLINYKLILPERKNWNVCAALILIVDTFKVICVSGYGYICKINNVTVLTAARWSQPSSVSLYFFELWSDCLSTTHLYFIHFKIGWNVMLIFIPAQKLYIDFQWIVYLSLYYQSVEDCVFVVISTLVGKNDTSNFHPFLD